MSNLLTNAVKNSSWTALSSLMTALIGFLFSGLTIRWLGQSEAGFAIALSTIIGINNTFSGLGLGSAATRLISRSYEENNSQVIQKIAGVCFSTSLAFGMLGLSVFSFGSTWIVDWAKYEGDACTGQLYCILLGLIFFIQQIIVYFNIFLTSLQKYEWLTKLTTIFLLSNGILGIIFLRAFPSILTLGTIQLGLACLNCLCTAFVVYKILGFLVLPSWNQSIFIDLWSFGKWVYLTQINGLLIDGADKIFLVTVFGSASLPSYTFAQRIFKTVHGTLTGQSSYLFPMLSAQGDKLELVAEQIEDRLRWFISLFSAFIYSGIIISGPAILTIMVNADFSNNTSFQLFIFCWVGYIHSTAIVPFFLGLSQGDSKGNWLFQMIIGFIYLPFFAFFAISIGFEYAVLGQLSTVVGIFFLSHRLKPKINFKALTIWIIRPLYSSLWLMFVASCLHLSLMSIKANSLLQISAMIIFYINVILLTPRIETYYFDGESRLRTLNRAILLILAKLGISENLSRKFISLFSGLPM